MPLLTPDILLKIVPTLKPDRAQIMTGLLNTICPLYGINSKDMFEEFIAQIAYESGGFRLKEENLNYTAKRLLEVFPDYFPTLDLATKYQNKSEFIANRVYANRLGNGDETSGDGFKFRGGGAIQLTGRDIYTAYSKYVNKPIDDVVNLVRTTDQYALDSACWFFAVDKKLLQLALDDNFQQITKRINGGFNGYVGRLEYYQRAKQFLV